MKLSPTVKENTFLEITLYEQVGMVIIMGFNGGSFHLEIFTLTAPITRNCEVLD